MGKKEQKQIPIGGRVFSSYVFFSLPLSLSHAFPHCIPFHSICISYQLFVHVHDPACSLEFCNQLQRLVETAPPLHAISDDPPGGNSSGSGSGSGSAASASAAQITQLQSTAQFQSILVTHFHHLDEQQSQSQSQEQQQQDQDQDDYTPEDEDEYHNPNHDNTTASFPEGAMRQDDEEEEDGYYSSNGEDDGDGDGDGDEDSSFDPPWPKEAHEAFCALPHVQDHVLLEIAAGRDSRGQAPRRRQTLVQKGQVQVVVPGSLRAKGQYCVVDVAFGTASSTAMNSGDASGGGGGGGDDYKWRVRRTRFRTLSEYV
jgi:hypothetical protein